MLSAFMLFSNIAKAVKVKTCLGGSFVEHHPQTGNTCFCEAEGAFVAKQECIDGGTGCTEIDCGN